MCGGGKLDGWPGVCPTGSAAEDLMQGGDTSPMGHLLLGMLA